MVMPSKSKIFEYWMDWLDKKGFDWGEPCCWACKKYWDGKYDFNAPGATREEIIKNWDRVPLQRCHIIARQFGGSDEPSNLFLMCSECHDKAPNTKSVEAFLFWTEQQDWNVNFMEEIIKEINTFGLQDRIAEVTEILSNKDLMEVIFNNLGIHMNQDGKGSQITLSTYVAEIYGYLKKQDELKASREDSNLA